MVVCGQTVLEVVGNKSQKLEWPGYGFYLEVPDEALPPGVTASVAVKVTLAGQFQYLISVYQESVSNMERRAEPEN